jgi:integrase
MAGRVFLRGSTYWIAFRYKGKEYRRSSKTDKKREADKLLAFYLAQCARDEFRGFQRDDAYTLFELLDDFIENYKQRGLRDVQVTRWRANNLRSFFNDIPVEDITERKIDLYIKHRLAMGRKRTTVNRDLQLLGQAMRLAVRKKLMKEIPHIEKFSEKGNARQGFFEQEELEKLVACLPAYLKDVARFAYHTGWRRTEIFTLEWHDIQGDIIRLRPEIAKSKDGRVLIMVGEIANIIARRQAERVDACPYIFHREGKRIANYYKAWRTACKNAGLPGKILHDNRRTAARNMDRAGVPRQTAKQIIGHKTDAMYNRYRIVNEQDIREGMMQAENYLASHNLGHHTDN